MTRGDSERIAHIIEAVNRCRQYADALTEADPVIAMMAEDAIQRNLQIIGEAVRHLSPGVTAAHPEIPWAQIRGFRNILVHQHFGVDSATVRDVVETHLPPLRLALERHIDP
ncbi:HepT-like ribonuclease domain-containing protein [Leucobacter massiliensis]|uniref:Toxin-antitoxin system antitoxin subunit n=1 Tax=Leucobacter massiliensis TaxID=1686285 RepID=A0A2S9QM39_9MICO|nr:HepT-like ribonuclease domain-containing protein [Leucobacter massiliensis]PRI10645.1 toxin-antitoxin system antitoxin subunit [Leucobacter massiliensis]